MKSMKLSVRTIIDSFSGFTAHHEKAIFTTLARILAIGCIAVAAYYAWKLGVQIRS